MTIRTIEFWWGRKKTRNSLEFSLATNPRLQNAVGPARVFLKV